MMIKGCLFDMDGVLLDTERLGMALLPQIAASHGYAVSQELIYQTLGMTDELGKRILLGALGADFPYDAVMREVYGAFMDRARAGTLPLKAGLAQCLAGLRARGIRVAIATSAMRSAVDVYMENVPELRGAFDAVVCGTDIPRSKPEPDIYLCAAERLGLAPGECIGVEDSLNGLKSLTAAGIRSVMIPDLIPYHERLSGLVTWTLASLSELCPLIDSLT